MTQQKVELLMLIHSDHPQTLYRFSQEYDRTGPLSALLPKNTGPILRGWLDWHQLRGCVRLDDGGRDARIKGTSI